MKKKAFIYTETQGLGDSLPSARKFLKDLAFEKNKSVNLTFKNSMIGP